MRRTPERPQLIAMSVALEDHGEIVPRRGTTRNGGATGGAAGGWPSSSNLSRMRRSAGSRARSHSAKWRNSAATARTPGSAFCSAERSLARRNSDSARAPRSCRTWATSSLDLRLLDRAADVHGGAQVLRRSLDVRDNAPRERAVGRDVGDSRRVHGAGAEADVAQRDCALVEHPLAGHLGEGRAPGRLPAPGLDGPRQIEASENAFVHAESALDAPPAHEIRRIRIVHGEPAGALGLAIGEQGRGEYRGVDAADRQHAVDAPAPAPSHVRIPGNRTVEAGTAPAPHL